MFCSTSVSQHLLRGIIALALIATAVYVSQFGWLWAGLPLLGAFVAMRGCPMCWLVGLFETIRQRQSRDNATMDSV